MATAASRRVALAGALRRAALLARPAFAERELDALNPGWLERHGWVESRPDGDVDLDDTHDFVVPRCPCGGPLKPDVVFFGENVPADRVARCYAFSPATSASASALSVRSQVKLFSVRPKWP